MKYLFKMVYVKFYFALLFLWGEEIIEFFHSLPMLIPCAVASLLEVSRGVSFGCNVFISFHVGMFIMFDSAPESIKKSISRSGG